MSLLEEVEDAFLSYLEDAETPERLPKVFTVRLPWEAYDDLNEEVLQVGGYRIELVVGDEDEDPNLSFWDQ